jgi:hypothetical protein
MMRKLDADASINDVLSQRRIYARMCIYDRVDTGVFKRAALDFGISAFKIGKSRILSSRQEGLGVRLEPVYTAAVKSIQENLETVSNCPEYPSMMNYWNICESLMKSKSNPEVAWIAFYHASKLYSSMMSAMRRGETWGHKARQDDEEQRIGRASRQSTTKQHLLSRTNSYDKMVAAALE